ncbi:hypothetical protein G7K_0787-t1 [Saitoella complicata NRRL Y-17804]|uniref:Ubiquitin carboxyl-terminal hydrolase n=1 Tax=Saitoella complicata (strain BCRC 22490 / CBS 7301 / JCM 7358 / NBRC 10748 / NRRL Y-17804) TaxID=698492 RepID=A0A0E9N9I9_SAICN|nr:hypothetical protein G7K_0787-t1 [Saitoella complicata NRRL Y-17804]
MVCKHTKDLLKEAGKPAMQAFNNAAAVMALYSVKDSKRMERASVFQKCQVCQDPLKRTFTCLQCPFVGCFRGKHAEAHAKKVGHLFAFDFASGQLYCWACQDYVYVPVFDKIRKVKETAAENRVAKRHANSKRVKLNDWEPTSEELAKIKENTKPPACQASGLRGIQNLGATCFMSVVLQSLIHNPLIRNYFLSERHSKRMCGRTHCVCCAMDAIVSEFFSSATEDIQSFGPSSFLATMWQSSTELAGYAQHDAHEFLVTLLNQIHLHTPTHTNKGHCHCIVHQTFGGVLNNQITCGNCGNVSVARDPMMDLSLSIASNGVPTIDGEGVTLRDCLERFMGNEKLGAEHRCEKCGAQESTKQMSIKKLPPVLGVQLKRFEHSSLSSGKVDTYVRFPIQLDMLPYTTRAHNSPEHPLDPESGMYDLFSVVCHVGQLNTGHYRNFARSGDNWFLFDDHMVTAATEGQVTKSQAYLLFYVKRRLEFADIQEA